MTPQTIITEARDILNDTDSAGYRQTDAELLRYVNDGMKEVSRVNPSLFTTLGDLICTAGAVEQTVTFLGAQMVTDVVCIHNGAAVIQSNMDALDKFLPSWRTATAGAAVNWMRKPNDPLRFFIYPPAPASQTLDVMYISNPTELAIGDTISEIPAAMQPALVDYVVYRAESKDDEHIASGRATSYFQAFEMKVKGS